MDSATNPWFKSSDWDINLVDPWQQYYFDYDDILRLPVLSLFPSGCGKDRNCTRACATLTEAFSDPPTLSNCIRYPLVASLLHNDLLSRNGMAQAQMLGFSNGSMTASKHSANAISGCLSSVPIVSPSSINTFTDANGVNYSYPDICSSKVPALNGDIGGIGVSTIETANPSRPRHADGITDLRFILHANGHSHHLHPAGQDLCFLGILARDLGLACNLADRAQNSVL